METADEGLTIISNTSTDGFEMDFGWRYSWRVGVTSALKGFSRFIYRDYGLSSIKPNDDSSRAARPSVCVSTAQSSLISFYNENEYGASRRSSRQTNHQEQDVTRFQSLFFWFYPKFRSLIN